MVIDDEILKRKKEMNPNFEKEEEAKEEKNEEMKEEEVAAVGNIFINLLPNSS